MTPTLRCSSSPAEIQILRSDNGPLVTQCAPKGGRPYLHPIMAPDGRGVLTENEPPHHPWQHGFYTGLNDVSGIGFWTEGRRNDPNDGTFHALSLSAPALSGASARWSVETEWRAPTAPTKSVPPGAAMLRETQAWSLSDDSESYCLDLEWTLSACIELTFGKYAYGGLFLRMPFHEGCNAMCLNSEGHAGTAGEGKRARWVAVAMNVAGRTNPSGIAIMDHPSNPEHPVPWRIDGQFGIAPSRCIAGAWTLARGQSVTFLHRVFVFCGAISPEKIEGSYARFVNSAVSA
ncbi:MAG TPA: PmoA family protein [Planctomycetota bacterium]|nr:PmoA family protein [Planctomycetota bacterium]